MSKYTLATREIPLEDGYDVVVAGGGPAGCTAAIAAAREGAKTLLIEAGGCLGGMGTAGLVPAWCPFSDREKIIYRGLAEKVFTLSKAGLGHVDPDALDWIPIDAEGLKRIYDELVVEAGVTVRFMTAAAAVETDGSGGVDALILSSKAGLTAVAAKVYVDCTGDGDLAAWAGAEFEMGGGSGELQPATHCFQLANVDPYHYRTGPGLHRANVNSPGYAIRDDDAYPDIVDVHMCNNVVGAGLVGFNAGHLWGADNTNPAAMSEAMMLGRRIARQLHAGLVKYHPKAFAASTLAATGALMGVREGRRVIGDYYLTLDDYVNKRSFDDEICRNSYFVDVHNTPDEARTMGRGMEEIDKRSYRYQPGESHGIPYRCLTPKGLRNVLTAGRNLSCDRMIYGSVRVMPPCLCMGEAAGVAAAMAAASSDSDVHAVDTDGLRDRLRSHGAYLP